MPPTFKKKKKKKNITQVVGPETGEQSPEKGRGILIKKIKPGVNLVIKFST